MTIKFNLQFYYFLIPLKSEVVVHNSKNSVREGIYIKIIDNDGYFGVGECAPLAGVHEETLDDCLSALEELKDDFKELKIDITKFNLQKRFFGLLDEEYEEYEDENENEEEENDEDDVDEEELPSTLIFALEEALLYWYINRMQQNFNFDAKNIVIPIYKLILSPPANEKEYKQIVNELKSFVLPAVKIKMNYKKQILNKQLEFIKKLKQENDILDLKIVLDFNMSFSEQEMDFVVNFLSSEKIDIFYFEDPVSDKATVKDLDKILKKYKYNAKLGLDELLFDYIDQNEQLEINNLPTNTKAIIIKPTVTTLSTMFKIAKDAQKKGITLVLSSTYDSSITLMLYSIIYINYFKNPNQNYDHFPQGLGTFEFMECDLSLKELDLRYEKGQLFFMLDFNNISNFLKKVTAINI
ncbi:MAG: hypothetical protein HQK51_03090 [Oligoflexia bacterium]|nr:hypothetical protein [Oligoflexia bacterium]